jgi:hypothetical protein
MRSKIGRPKKRSGERKSKVIQVRLNPEDYKIVCEAIRNSDQEQSDWIRDALLTKATRGGGAGGLGGGRSQ